MEPTHPTRIPRHLHSQLTRINCTININPTYHIPTGTRVTHPNLHEKLQWPGMDVKVIFWSSQIWTIWQIIMIVGMDPHQQRGFPTIPTHQRYRKHHNITALEGFPHLRWINHQYFQPPPTITSRGVITHQTADQISSLRYFF